MNFFIVDLRPVLDTAFLVMAIMVFSSGCKSDTIILTPPVGPVEDVSFSADVNPIFQSSCSGSGCHIGHTTNGVNLTNYASVLGSVAQSYGKNAILPSDAEGSPLVNIIGPVPLFGSRMPQGRPAFSQDQITIIREWIDDGAQDN